MATATAKKPMIPIEHRLHIAAPPHGPLTKGNAAKFSDYLAAAADAIAAEEMLANDRATLLATGYDLTIAQVAEEGRSLRDRHEILTDQQNELQQQKWALAAEILPDAVRTMNQLLGELNSACSTAHAELKELGIDSKRWTAGGPRVFILRAMPLLKDKGKLALSAALARYQEIKAATEVLQVWAEIGTRDCWSSVKLPWTAPATEEEKLVAMIADVTEAPRYADLVRPEIAPEQD